MNRKILRNKPLLLLVILGFMVSACQKDDKTTPVEDAVEDSYIPRTNVKYEYGITEDGENIGTETRWIDGSRDSSGIKLYNLHTNLVTPEGAMGMDNELYVANGRTYTEFDMPEAWQMMVEEMKKNPDIVVEEAKYTGFPGFMVMENAMKKGSKLTWELPAAMGQYLRYRSKDSQNAVIEITQKIAQHPGAVDAIESVTVPAGTFSCSKFVYEIAQEQVAKIDGEVFMTFTGTESITVWMAHGVGVVKEENITVFNGNTNHTVTVLNKIKS